MARPAAPERMRLARLGWPLYLELLLGVGVGLVGTTLAARVSDASGASFALANHVAQTLFLLFRIIGAGIGVVVAQQLGAARRDGADAVARAAVGASTWLGGACALMAALGAAPLMRVMHAPADVAPIATAFLQWLALPLLVDAWNASMSAVLRAHLRSRETLAVIVVMHSVHLALAAPLMSGLGPLPPMGLAGYALALGTSRIAGLALHLWLWRTRLDLPVRLRDVWHLPRAEVAAMLHIGVPGAAENLSWRLAFMASVAAAGVMGSQALATQTYVMQVNHLILIFAAATGLSIEVLVGRLIGAGQLRQAHQLVRHGLARGIAASALISLGFALVGPWLLRLFTHDEAILRQGAMLLWLNLLLEPGRVFNLVVINALRAAGDARYPVFAGALSVLLVLAGGSWLLGVVWGWGLIGLWLAYAADEWIRGLLMWRRWVRLRWVPHARRGRRRLGRLEA